MMTDGTHRPVEMIAIAQITVLNPRARNKRQHREIIDNVDAIGLKRPITVRRRTGSSPEGYDLVCGEGRLEAFRALGATEIPAIVIDVSESECMVMSLVENIARRQHRAIDLMQEIGSLHARGYSDAESARKVGVTVQWVNMIVTLLEQGEERLVAAVETGMIPVSFAVDIARAQSTDVQAVLMDAYAAGKIKGKKLTKIRRMLEQRLKRSKDVPDSGFGRRSAPRKMTQADLMRIYQREAEKQRLLVKKAEYTQTKLLFLIEALKDLMADEGYTTLLRAEGLDTLPRALAGRMFGEVRRG